MYPDMKIPKVLHHPPQKWILAQKRPNLAQKRHFWPNIRISIVSGPIDLLPEQKTMRTSYLGGLSIMWVPKLLLTPVKIRNFGPKTAKFGQNMHFGPNIGIFCPFGPMPDG